jgi:hypothetical protein
VQVKERLQQGSLQQKYQDYQLHDDGILLFKNRVDVPNSLELRNLVIREMHGVPYVGHPGYQKIITSVRGWYFWPSMKRVVADYLTRCMEFQKVKVEHRHMAELLQPLPIHEWKWDVVAIEFIIKLLRTT